MELGQFWMIFTIGVSWLCLIPAKSVQTVYIAPVFFIALEVMGMGYKLVANGQCSFTVPDKTRLARAEIICNCLPASSAGFLSIQIIIPRIFVSGQQREISCKKGPGNPVESWGELGRARHANSDVTIKIDSASNPACPLRSALDCCTNHLVFLLSEEI